MISEAPGKIITLTTGRQLYYEDDAVIRTAPVDSISLRGDRTYDIKLIMPKPGQMGFLVSQLLNAWGITLIRIQKDQIESESRITQNCEVYQKIVEIRSGIHLPQGQGIPKDPKPKKVIG